MTAAALASVEHARERTLAAGSARIEFMVDRDWHIAEMPHRRRGGLLRPLLNAGKSGAKRLLKAAAPRGFDFRHQTAEGIIDVAGRRFMLDYGSYARLYADGQLWHGRSGRRLATLPAHELPPDATPATPLWLLDLVAGIFEASDTGGGQEVRGAACRHLSATTDLSRATKATPGGIGVPARKRFEDLLSMPVELWLDDTHIRRVRFSSQEANEHRSEALELWDFGVALDEFDWTRLPTFRSPDEAVANRAQSAR